MTVCAVLGCDTNSKKHPEFKFHRLPRKPEARELWLRLIGTPASSLGLCPRICSKHIEPQFYTHRGDATVLARDAVPTLFMPKVEIPEEPSGPATPVSSSARQHHMLIKKITWLRAKLMEARRSNKSLKAMLNRKKKTPLTDKSTKEASDVRACRICLAVDARLYPIPDVALEDSFVELTGTSFSVKDGLPRHLCAFCCADLSKCASFRDRCQRAQELLETLREWGPLKLADVAAIDRRSHQLTPNLTRSLQYNFDLTDLNSPLTPVTKSETNENNIYIDSTKFTVLDELIKDDDGDEVLIKSDDTVLIKVEDADDIEVDFDEPSDTLEEVVKSVRGIGLNDPPKRRIDSPPASGRASPSLIIKSVKKVKKRQLVNKFNVVRKTAKSKGSRSRDVEEPGKRKIVNGENYPDFDYEEFEKECKVKIKLLTEEEQRQEIEERKASDNYLEAPYHCEMCGKGYNHQESLRNHMVFHDPGRGRYSCEICHVRFSTKSKRTSHRDMHRVKITCDDCGFVSRDRLNAKRHFEVHTGKTFTCPHCGQQFKIKTSFLSHVRIQHPAHNVACDQCGETFLSQRGVLQHKTRIHREDVKPVSLKCPTCDINFSNSEALDRHVTTATDATHVSLRPCVSCGENCRSDDELATHGEQCQRNPLHCDECNQTFSNASSFDTHHRRKHQNQRIPQRGGGFYKDYYQKRPIPVKRRVVCEICGMLVQSRTALKYHLGTHADVKPYACSKCPKTFAAKHSLEWHMRTHTGEMPYQCEICQRQFNLESNLKRHLKVVHLGQRKSVPCELCGKTLSSPSCLKLHIRTVHNNMPQPRRKRRRPKKEPFPGAMGETSD